MLDEFSCEPSIFISFIRTDIVMSKHKSCRSSNPNLVQTICLLVRVHWRLIVTRNIFSGSWSDFLKKLRISEKFVKICKIYEKFSGKGTWVFVFWRAAELW